MLEVQKNFPWGLGQPEPLGSPSLPPGNVYEVWRSCSWLDSFCLVWCQSSGGLSQRPGVRFPGAAELFLSLHPTFLLQCTPYDGMARGLVDKQAR